MFQSVRLIAWRFMLKGTERGRFSAMTLFAWLAIGVGVGTMSTLLSVMYGLESSLRDNVLRAYPHILVRPEGATTAPIKEKELTEAFRKVPGVTRVTPYVETEMIAQSMVRTLGVVIWGVPESEWERLKPDIRDGKLPSLDSPVVQGVLGGELADHLNIEVGEKLELISPLNARERWVGCRNCR